MSPFPLRLDSVPFPVLLFGVAYAMIILVFLGYIRYIFQVLLGITIISRPQRKNYRKIFKVSLRVAFDFGRKDHR